MALPFFLRFFRRAPTLPPCLPDVESVGDDPERQFQAGLQLDQAHSEGGQDGTLAAQWYLRAAEQNHAGAQYHLGVLYDEGRGVPRDEALSAQWIQRAAQQGYPAAQFALGMRHYRAVIQTRSGNLPESKAEAYKWLQLAAAQSYPDAETVCCRVILSMTRDQVRDGNRRVATFLDHSRLPTSTAA